jgi:hypothetical protein
MRVEDREKSFRGAFRFHGVTLGGKTSSRDFEISLQVLGGRSTGPTESLWMEIIVLPLAVTGYYCL